MEMQELLEVFLKPEMRTCKQVHSTSLYGVLSYAVLQQHISFVILSLYSFLCITHHPRVTLLLPPGCFTALADAQHQE